MGPYSILDMRKLEKEIAQITVSHGCTLYGFADLQGYTPGKLAKLHRGISFVFQMEPWVMDQLAHGPTDASLKPAVPIEKSLCGKCTKCIESCPAEALKGGSWYPGVERDVILDAWACDRYKKNHFHKFHGGHNCGICTQACPVGQKVLRK